MHRVIPGDGIGVDVTAEALKVLEAAGERFGLEFPWSADHYLESGETLPAEAAELAAWREEVTASLARLEARVA